MQFVGRILGAVAVIGLLAGSAAAQKGPAKYGEEDKPKTPAEIAAERDAEKAYRRSLGNIPEQQKSTDPWGTVRSDSAPPKAAANKAPQAKPKAKSAEGAAK